MAPTVQPCSVLRIWARPISPFHFDAEAARPGECWAAGGGGPSLGLRRLD